MDFEHDQRFGATLDLSAGSGIAPTPTRLVIFNTASKLMSIKRLLPREPSWHRLGGIVAGQTGRLEGVRSALADVRFGSKDGVIGRRLVDS